MTKTMCAVALLLAACGGSKGPAADSTAGHDMHAMHEGGEGHEHPAMPAEMAAFHDVLSPRWHTEPAQARMDKVCANGDVDAVTGPLDALVAAPAPAGVDAEAWATTARDMKSAFGDVYGACSLDLATFDAQFGAAHDLFHKLMDLLPKAGEAS